jgi:long-chain acyl-CoA synthetase
LGEDALIYSITQTKMKAIFCNASNVQLLKSFTFFFKTFSELKKENQIPDLQYVIYANEYKSDDKETDLEIFSFTEVEKAGEKNALVKLTPPKPDDIAVVMYTSGSTGNGILFNSFSQE